MIIYPAIDLKNGKCVRLYQGDFTRETIYSSDPLLIAKHFIDAGAEWLHVVDLDGAKNPSSIQMDLLSKLIKLKTINIQIGGGIRTKSQIEYLLELGASRVIIGSAAISQAKEVIQWYDLFGQERLVLALDIIYDEIMQPKVASHAWNKISAFSVYDLIEKYKNASLKHLLCTNILLDGTLNGPDFDLYQSLLTKFPFLNIQASAGIQSLEDIRKLKKLGLAGAIIGRAFYENKLTLSEVLQC